MRKYTNTVKMTAAMLIAGLILGSSTPVMAASDASYTKNENVYVRLDEDGDADGAYVVNSFNVTSEGEITDYGDYAKIQNLTNFDEIEQDKDEQTFQAGKGKFYYQGDLDKTELPWEFDVTYKLDGDEVESEELAGAEGDLELTIKTRKNQACDEKDFYNKYMLQVSILLDNELCEKIKAEDATITDAGSDEQITFTVNPGTNATMKVTASIENFEMDDISIAAVPVRTVKKSFVSEDNDHMNKTSFMMSIPGVTIPDPAPATEETEEEEGLVEKIKSLF